MNYETAMQERLDAFNQEIEKTRERIFYLEIRRKKIRKIVRIAIWCAIAAIIVISTVAIGRAEDWTNDQIADAIYIAEGGSKTNHPYGILEKYKHTTPREACINTIKHARRDWNGKGEFLVFLRDRYCPIGASNDPTGLNINWLTNVKFYLQKVK